MATIDFESCGFKTREIQPPVSWREATKTALCIDSIVSGHGFFSTVSRVSAACDSTLEFRIDNHMFAADDKAVKPCAVLWCPYGHPVPLLQLP